MIVYSKTKVQFVADVRTNRIEDHILAAFVRALRRHPSPSETASWKHSLQFVRNVLDHPELADDAGVAVEFTIPMTSKRVDVIVSGLDAHGIETLVIIELKQWSDVTATERDAVVRTVIGGGIRDVVHPSYQAWTYATPIEDFNETVREAGVRLVPCAFLHNLKDGTALNDPRYAEHLERAPVFLHADTERFSSFLRGFVRSGDRDRLLYRIENGRLRPSRGLADVLLGLLAGRPEFRLIDEQKLVYETTLARADNLETGKRVLIVRGGPGTGKSVVAINLLVALIDGGKVTRYVSRNAAPRAVYSEMLSGTHPTGRIRNLFGGTGQFTEAPSDLFDVLLIDEAHRITEKGGFYGNQGENQIKELINAARLSVFFLDEDQRVTIKDIGTRDEIRAWAAEHGATVEELELPSQFRCNGSDGYVAFLDDALGIRETANPTISRDEYDFRVYDDPLELRDAIRELDSLGRRARLVAGYCWPWSSKKDPGAMDIVLADGEFQAQWNLEQDGSLWIIGEDSVEQIGCIHTCQGLELDYVGVIVGPDLIVRNGFVRTDGHGRASQDRTIRGWKKMMRADPERTAALVDTIIRNTYRTLMSRGMRGCFVHCTDAETNRYFRSRIEELGPSSSSDVPLDMAGRSGPESRMVAEDPDDEP